MSSIEYRAGQCYASTAEPELGCGLVLKLDDRVLTIFFSAVNELRNYSKYSAPLKRVIYDVGSVLHTVDGNSLTVEGIAEQEGLIVYKGNGLTVLESQIEAKAGNESPEERLKSSDFDDTEEFKMRLRALEMRKALRESRVCGLNGARVDLIPHQLYIAYENSTDRMPRVLLADEVGLGKTIEAGLIMHRLLQLNMISRVLIIVPEALVHQWLVEMLRKFNLRFSLVTKDWCEADKDCENYFAEDELIIASLDFVSGNQEICQQMLNEKFDLVIVDEAHKLQWNENNISKQYSVVERLAVQTPGLILLTATPEHFGIEGHYARLRLIDSERFFSLRAFQKEAEEYRHTAMIAERIISGKDLTESQIDILNKIFDDTDFQQRNNEELLQLLLDRHGLNHVMYRNSRRLMNNFPKRIPLLYNLAADKDELISLTKLYDKDGNINNIIAKAKIAWLAQILEKNSERKYLLICSSRKKAEKIAAMLAKKITVAFSLFHENMTIVQRDRNAAYFADSDNGAQLLICSEIGSEGRNFQFAHDLIMFDLPLDPALIEQRIGRIDRIGQNSDVNIHVPFVADSSEEIVARWYSEGLRSFSKSMSAGFAMIEPFKQRIVELAGNFNYSKETLEKLLVDSKKIYEKIIASQREGRDHILEMNSHNSAKSSELVALIEEESEKIDIRSFMRSMLEFYGIKIDELSRNDWYLSPEALSGNTLPGLPDEGTTITFSRKTACAREDLNFVTEDSAMLRGAIDMLLSSKRGSCALTFMEDAQLKGIFIEAVFVIAAVAPRELHIERFLPEMPLKLSCDTAGGNEDVELEGKTVYLSKMPELPQKLLFEIVPAALRKLSDRGKKITLKVIEEALFKSENEMENQLNRLTDLAKNNPNITQSDIEKVALRKEQITDAISKAELRLDALRIIISR